MSLTNSVSAEPTAFGISSRRLVIALYASSVFLFWMAQYIYLPTLPTYTQSKVNDLSTVGLVLSMYGLWQAIVRLPIGIASDWLGWRKPFLVGGLALSGIGAWAMGIAGDANGLAAGRAVTGIAAGSWVVLVVAFSALFPPREAVRASALLTLVNTLGRIFATAIAGPLIDLGGATLPFFAATGIGLFSALLVIPISEPRRESKTPSVSAISRLLMRRDVLVPTLLSTVAQFALWTTSFGFLTLLAKNLGATNVLQSAVVTVHLIFVVLGNVIASRFTRRFGAPRLVIASFVLLFIGMIVAALAPTLPILFIAPVFIGTALGVGYPVTMGMSIEHVDEAERTIAMGLHQAIYAIGMFVGPALSGVVAEAIGLQPMFGITGVACFVLGLIGTRMLDANSRASEIESADAP
jgi:MFS family permease